MRRLRSMIFLGAVCLGPVLVAVPHPLTAQGTGPTAASETWPRADRDDVQSIDAVIAALYDVISGPAGAKRDWDRFRSLHAPGARLIPTFRNQSGEFGNVIWSPDEYASTAGASLEDSGFFEVEIARTTERYGDIAHAFSTYESRRNADDAEPFTRGINSIQLMHDGDRWWILNIFWAGERPDMPIPGRYLPDGE